MLHAPARCPSTRQPRAAQTPGGQAHPRRGPQTAVAWQRSSCLPRCRERLATRERQRARAGAHRAMSTHVSWPDRSPSWPGIANKAGGSVRTVYAMPPSCIPPSAMLATAFVHGRWLNAPSTSRRASPPSSPSCRRAESVPSTPRLQVCARNATRLCLRDRGTPAIPLPPAGMQALAPSILPQLHRVRSHAVVAAPPSGDTRGVAAHAISPSMGSRHPCVRLHVDGGARPLQQRSHVAQQFERCCILKLIRSTLQWAVCAAVVSQC